MQKTPLLRFFNLMLKPALQMGGNKQPSLPFLPFLQAFETTDSTKAISQPLLLRSSVKP